MLSDVITDCAQSGRCSSVSDSLLRQGDAAISDGTLSASLRPLTQQAISPFNF